MQRGSCHTLGRGRRASQSRLPPRALVQGGGQGERVDLTAGEITDTGHALQAMDLGATLLALGDVDPGAVVPEASVIAAAMT